jgi:hypothetical protein
MKVELVERASRRAGRRPVRPAGRTAKRSIRSVLLDRAPLRGRELLVCVLALAVLAAVVFGPYVIRGGLYEDDWGFYSIVAGRQGLLHQAAGFSWTSSRPVQVIYWPLLYGLVGPTAGLRVWAIVLAVLMASALFAVLRLLSVERVYAGVIAALVLLFPASDATRFWPAASIGSFALTLYLAGLATALLALRRHGRGALFAHACSLGLYCMSLLSYEVATVAIAASGVLYQRVAERSVALRRWFADLALLGTVWLLFISRTMYQPQSLSGDLSQLKDYADETLTLLGGAVVPFGAPSRLVGALALLAVVSAGLAGWRLRHAAATELRRCTAIAAVGVLVILVAYAVYLPTGDFYPAAPGTFNRVNQLAAIGYVLIVVAIVMAITAAARRMPAPVRRVTLVVQLALIALIAAGYIRGLARDRAHWVAAADQQRAVVRTIARTLGRPARGTVIFAFSQSIFVAPDVPVFDENDDLGGALEARFTDPSLRAYPVPDGIYFDCTAHGLDSDPYGSGLSDYGDLQRAPYGETVFIDVKSGKTLRITSRHACREGTARFTPGAVNYSYG